MLRIKKFRNVFGIKSLSGAENLGRINVIYAPNGTAKSSFCDAIKNISEGKDVSDIFGNLPSPEYELIVDGKTIDQNTNDSFNVVCFSGISEYIYNQENEKLINLAISNDIKKKVSESRKKVDDYINKIQLLIQGVFGSDFGKKKFNDSINYLTNIFDLPFSLESISSLVAGGEYDDIGIKFTAQDFYLFATSKVDAAVHKDGVIEKGKEYFESVDKKLKTDIFDESFTYFNLNNVYQSAISNNYFDDKGKRLLKINDVEYKKEDIEKFLDDKSKQIFGSKELSLVFEGVKKDISKNKETVELFDFLKKNPSIFLKLDNYKRLVLSIFASLFSDEQINELKKLNSSLDDENNKISKIVEEKVNDTKIHEIWSKFKRNFSTTKFDLDIKNKVDSYLGISVPTFVKCSKENGEEIMDPDELRFSTGEKRVYNFINLIIDIESKRDGKPLTVIFDDAAESFDYKNKFGIIDYISSIADDNNLQLIILTHNFDFYRSIILAIQEQDKKLYFAYRNSMNEVTFYDSNKKYYLNVSNFNSWKNNPSIEQYFSLIGFSRQIIQFGSSAHEPDVLTLDNYLHYFEGTTDVEDFSGAQGVLSKLNINLPASLNVTDNYLKTLYKIAIDLCNKSIVETDLEFKLTLGLSLRVFFERMIFLEYKNVHHVSLIITDQFNRSKELLNVAKVLFSNDDFLYLTEINTINPSYVHINGFMYEPLIDVGFEKLVELFNWLSNKNAKFPL